MWPRTLVIFFHLCVVFGTIINAGKISNISHSKRVITQDDLNCENVSGACTRPARDGVILHPLTPSCCWEGLGRGTASVRQWPKHRATAHLPCPRSVQGSQASPSTLGYAPYVSPTKPSTTQVEMLLEKKLGTQVSAKEKILFPKPPSWPDRQCAATWLMYQ